MFCSCPAPTGPPQNLQVFNATTITLTVKWDHAPGRVQNYKITYVPTAGGKTQSVKPGPANSHTGQLRASQFQDVHSANISV